VGVEKTIKKLNPHTASRLEWNPGYTGGKRQPFSTIPNNEAQKKFISVDLHLFFTFMISSLCWGWQLVEQKT